MSNQKKAVAELIEFLDQVPTDKPFFLWVSFNYNALWQIPYTPVDSSNDAFWKE